MNRPFLFFAVCLCVLFLFASVQAQEESRSPSLQDAKTIFDIVEYINHELGKIGRDAEPKQRAASRAGIFMAASDRLLAIAKEGNEGRNDRSNAYDIRLDAFQAQIEAEIEGAQQRMEAFLDELAAQEETRYRAEGLRFQLFTSEAMKTINTPEGWDAFKAGLKTWIYRNIDWDDMRVRSDRIVRAMFSVAERRKGDTEQFAIELIEDLTKYIQSQECTLSADEKRTLMERFNTQLQLFQFGQFYRRALETVNSPESFDEFKTELKSWINRKTVNVNTIPQLGLLVAEKNSIPAEQIINELIEFLQSPELSNPRYSDPSWTEYFVTNWKKFLLTAFGSELKLYGRTLDDNDFDWESLRGKYVLVQFTATWCGPCHMEIPGMLEAYQKYHDKGFEIVSIYIWERGADPVAAIREHVEHSKLPWIIISETLTQRAGQPSYEQSFAITGVPMMLLVDKTGKIIMTQARGAALQARLAEIFE